MSEKRKVHAALAMVSFLFGISYVLTKIIVHDVPPKVWTLYRVLLATATLAPFLYKSTIWKLLKSPRLWLSGLLGVSLNQLLFAEGLKRTTPGHSALINACIPAVTLLCSIANGGERWSLRSLFGILFAVSGVIILVGRPMGGAGVDFNTMLWGDLLTAGNVLSLSLFFVISRPIAVEYRALGLTGFYFLEGALVLGLYSAFTGTFSDGQGWELWKAAPGSTHLIMLFVAISSSTVTYTLNNWSLRRAAPSQVATYITLQPVIATLMSAVVFHEALSTKLIPSFALIAIGVFLASTATVQKTVTHPAKKEDSALGLPTSQSR